MQKSDVDQGDAGHPLAAFEVPHDLGPVQLGRPARAGLQVEAALEVHVDEVVPTHRASQRQAAAEHLDAEAPAGLYGYQADPGTTEYPLALISPSSERTVTSTLAELSRPEVRLLMHADDAAARGLEDGDPVRIFNTLGEVRCNLRVGVDIRPGTVSLPKGLWRKHTANGYTATALAPDTLTDLGGGACFNDARVEVSRAEVVH